MLESPHHHVEQELRRALAELRQAGVDTPQLDAELLMAHVTGLSRTQLIAHPQRSISEEEHELFRHLVGKRSERYPLPYITGKKEFWGMEFEVNPSVLIPRPETELLVEAAAQWLKGRPSVVAEIGVGSGAIVVALAKELPDAAIFGSEISPQAAATAARNAGRHLVAERVRILVGDLAQPLLDEGLAGTVDAIVSNPPYIAADAVDTMQPEVLYEPREATIAGADALHFHRRILAGAPKLLKQGGRVFLEIDPGQSQPIAEIGEHYGIKFIETRRDLAGLERLAVLECVSFK